MVKKNNFSKNWIVSGVIILTILGLGIIVATRIELPFGDDNSNWFTDNPFPTPTPTNGEEFYPPTPPPFYPPILLREGCEVDTPDYYTAEIIIRVAYPESVLTVYLKFFVDGYEESYVGTTSNPVTGTYTHIVQKSSLNNVFAGSLIIVKVMVKYTAENGAINFVIENDVLSFVFKHVPDPTPTNGETPTPTHGEEFYPPKLVYESITCEVIDDYLLALGFSIVYFENVTNVYSYFVLEGEIVKSPSGNNIITELNHEGFGFFSGTIDVSMFEITETPYIFIRIDFLDENGDKDYLVEKEVLWLNWGGSKTEETGHRFLVSIPLSIFGIVIVLTLTKLSMKKKEEKKNDE